MYKEAPDINYKSLLPEEIEKLASLYWETKDADTKEDILNRITTADLSPEQLRELRGTINLNAIKMAKNFYKAKKILESAKGSPSRQDLLRIATIPLGPYYHERLGVARDVKAIYDEARQKLLDAGFDRAELDKTLFAEMVELAFLEELVPTPSSTSANEKD